MPDETSMGKDHLSRFTCTFAVVRGLLYSGTRVPWFHVSTPPNKCSHLSSLGTSEKSLTASCAVESPQGCRLGVRRPGKSRSHVLLVAVRLNPRLQLTESATKPSPRRVATPEPVSSSRSRGLFYVAVPECPAVAAVAGSSR
jgi:hypothetical protein